MRISDWSSDVCSSDLRAAEGADGARAGADRRADRRGVGAEPVLPAVHEVPRRGTGSRSQGADRKSVVKGKRVSVRVDLGGRRILKKKNNKIRYETIRHTLRHITEDNNATIKII